MASNTKSNNVSSKEVRSGAPELYNFLFEACNILRGPVSQDNFKDYKLQFYTSREYPTSIPRHKFRW